MMDLEQVRKEISEYTRCEMRGERVSVATQYMYPSNGSVFVYVIGGPNRGFLVTDDGGALTEISRYGLRIEGEADRFLRPVCKHHGLEVKSGAIFTQQIPLKALAVAISMVAAASAEAATRGIEKFKPRKHRNIRRDVWTLLNKYYSKQELLRHPRITGESNKQYQFDYGILAGGDKLIVLDTVLPEPASVNAKVVAHFDVGRLPDEMDHRMIYDDQDEWNASDLSLLQMAALVVPFSQLDEILKLIRR